KNAETIQCRMCHLQFPGNICSRGRGICNADINEACVIGRIFKGNGTAKQFFLVFMGCHKNFADVENIKWDAYTVNFHCCGSFNLCNELL
ncbi:prostate and testis expressed protein 1-like, partial [Tenrec ecaudatus]|uniref:prostate and testis expressed protein 1-like n=1 Tax=Tenrec ecaudatus TaxID=94439 RepID=UPI003F5A0FEA